MTDSQPFAESCSRNVQWYADLTHDIALFELAKYEKEEKDKIECDMIKKTFTKPLVSNVRIRLDLDGDVNPRPKRRRFKSSA